MGPMHPLEDQPDPPEILAGAPEVRPATDPARPEAPFLDLSESASPATISFNRPHSMASQEYLRMAFRLRDLAAERGARTIVVTSAEPSEGKTTTVCNLAIQLAKLDQSSRIALVDLDLHRASIASMLGLVVRQPIDAVIRGEIALMDARVQTNLEGLSLFALDRPAPHPERLFAQPNFKAALEELSRRFDLVLIDSPPVLSVSDAQIIMRHADAGILVARAGQTQVRLLRRSLDHLPADKLLGTLLNDRRGKSALQQYAEYDYRGEESKPSPDEEASHGQG